MCNTSVIDIIVYSLFAFIIFLIGIFVLTKRKGNMTNLFFAIICFSLALAIIANYFSLKETEPDVILFWMRLVMALAVIIFIFFFLFIHHFPKAKLQLNVKKLSVLLFLGLLAIINCFTPFLFKAVKFTNDQRAPVFSWGISIFIIVGIGFLLVGVIDLILKLKKSTGLIRSQLKYILFGFLLMFFLILFFNFILVIFFDNSRFMILVPLFTLPFIIFTNIAIVKHRLMGLRLVIGKGVIYTVTVAIAFGLYTALVFLAKKFFETGNFGNRFAINSIVIILIALGFEPLRRGVKKVIDAWFFPEGKKIEKSLQKMKEELPKTVDFDKFAQALAAEINKILSVANINFFLLNKKEGIYHQIFPENEKDRIKLRLDDIMVKYILSHKEIVIQEELALISENLSQVEKEEAVKIGRQMEKQGWAAVLPVGFEQANGLLCLSQKTNKDAYTSEDLKFLDNLKNQASQALDNAILYKEAVERIKVS